MKEQSFLISGGGTGGHIYPAIAIADGLKEKYPKANFLFVGASDRMEMQKVPNAGYKIEGLWISGLQRGQIIKNLLIPFKLISSLWNSYKIIKKQKPNVAIGTGGYASAALLKMAGIMGVPTVVQEQNSYPGITNKLLANKAAKICVAYEGLEKFFPSEKILITGNPVRKDILNTKVESNEAVLHFGLKPNKKTLLVLGGSLGAKAINELIADRLSFFEKQGVQVLDRMDLAYASAEVIISRAGASSVSELAIVGKPVLFIPSPYVAEDHQTKNAQAIVNKDAAYMIKQSDLEIEFENQISDLFNNEEIKKSLSHNLKQLAKQNATADIVGEIIKIIED